MKGFKKCSKGHFYKDDLRSCPYCLEGGGANENVGMPASSRSNEDNSETKNFDGFVGNNAANNGSKTEFIGAAPSNKKTPVVDNSRTIIVGDEENETGEREQATIVARRTLVGWLVTYSHDKEGNDYRIFEGKNVIGRDLDCDIAVANDKSVSGKHAVITYRNKQYVILDTSANGTFVNYVDIGIGDKAELKDGDIIKVGGTEFLFRSSLIL